MLPLLNIKTLTPPELIFSLVLLLWTVVEVPHLLRFPLGNTAETHDRGSLLVALGGLWLGMMLASVLTIVARWAIIGMPVAGVLFGSGIALILIGIAFRSYAIFVLGRYFMPVVAIQPGQQLIQRGPYRFIRHPSYTGALISLLGVGLTLANWMSLLVLMTCGLAGFIYRMHVEEHALVQAFGQPYTEYMRHTWRLVPFIY